MPYKMDIIHLIQDHKILKTHVDNNLYLRLQRSTMIHGLKQQRCVR